MNLAERSAALAQVAEGQTVQLTWPLEWKKGRKTYNYSKGTAVKKHTLNGPVVVVEIAEGFGEGRTVPILATAEFLALEIVH